MFLTSKSTLCNCICCKGIEKTHVVLEGVMYLGTRYNRRWLFIYKEYTKAGRLHAGKLSKEKRHFLVIFG
jgi:hypothetical protein